MTDSARPTNGLSKQERLCGKREIATLLDHGRWGGSACLRFCCLVRKEDTEAPDRMMVSVPKKHFKRAVRRNLLKRRIREAFRQQKSLLHEAGEGERRYDILFTYASAGIASSEEIRAAVADILEEVRGWQR